MRNFHIPENFFKSISEKGKLYSRTWVYWLGGYADELFEPDFVEKQERQMIKHQSFVSKIREIYEFGIQLLRDGEFKIVEVKGKKKRVVPKVTKEVADIIDGAIGYLNSKVGSKFDSKADINVKIVLARIKEGYGIEDFMTVVDAKVYDWLGTDMEKHLIPSTLFSERHFENYLNSKKRNVNEFPKTTFDALELAVRQAQEMGRAGG